MCLHIRVRVCIYIHKNVIHMPSWWLLKLEVVHGAQNQSDNKYLGDNLSSGLKAASVVCHCTGADSAQTVSGRTRETAFSGKGLWRFFNQKLSQTWGVSLQQECNCTKRYEDMTVFAVLQDWLRLITVAGKSVPCTHWLWSVNLTEKNIFFAHSLNYSIGKALLIM